MSAANQGVGFQIAKALAANGYVFKQAFQNKNPDIAREIQVGF
ncbi:hypothetical protein [Dyadobacter chenwenxiniae]|nr:hypothetical protein [Dyadobacter chenwenxiniae]